MIPPTILKFLKSLRISCDSGFHSLILTPDGGSIITLRLLMPSMTGSRWTTSSSKEKNAEPASTPSRMTRDGWVVPLQYFFRISVMRERHCFDSGRLRQFILSIATLYVPPMVLYSRMNSESVSAVVRVSGLYDDIIRIVLSGLPHFV